MLDAFAYFLLGIPLFFIALNVIIRRRTKLCQIQGRISERLAIVTGANSGIGRATTAELARRGTTVIMACRDVNSALEAKKWILNRYGRAKGRDEACNIDVARPEIGFFLTPVEEDQLIIEHLDLSSLDSVRLFAERINTHFGSIDYLVNNAGVAYQPYSRTQDGFEVTVGVNYLAHFLLTSLMLPAIKRAAEARGDARIVNVSSLAHRFGKVPTLFPRSSESEERAKYSRLQAYADSKLAQVMHSTELARQLEGTNVKVVSLHPGTCLTNIVRIPVLKQLLEVFAWPFLKSAWEGAQTTLFTILSMQIKSGAYYSDCAEATANPLASDEHALKKFWENSERAVEAFLPK